MRDKNRDSFELRALQRVAQSGARALDLDVVLDRCLEQAIQVAGADGGAIYLRDVRRDVARKTVQHDMPDDVLPATIDLKFVDAHITEPYQVFDTAEVATRGGPISARLMARGYRCAAAVRFVVDERQLGFLALVLRQPRQLPDSTRDTLLAMAAFEAVAIAAARVHAELYERARVANLLRDFGERALDPDADVPRLVLGAARAVAGADRALVSRIYEHAPGERWVRVEHAIGDFAERLLEVRLPLNSRYVSEALTQPLVCEDTADLDPATAEALLGSEVGVKSFIIVTMRHGDRPIGQIVVGSSAPRQFSDAEVEGMELFSPMAAAALERARRQKEERAQHAELAAVIEHLPVVVYVINKTGEILHINAAARAFVSEIGGDLDNWRQAFARVQVFDRDGNTVPNDERPSLQAFAGKVPAPREFVVVAGEHRQTMMTVAAPLPNSDGTVDTIVVAQQDVSQLRALADSKDRFISIASHELRSPITSLRATTSLLELDPTAWSDEARRGTLLQRIQRQTDRLAALVERLLDTARLNARELPLEECECDLNQLAKEAIDLVKPSLKDHTVVLDERAQLRGRWDPARVEQVLTNLLSNAARYSPPSEIRVVVRRDGERACVDVIDRGVGIADDELAHVFTPFFRGKHAAAQHKAGLGLGLYITHEIVRRHRGTLKVKSELGKGSTFTVELPLA